MRRDALLLLDRRWLWLALAAYALARVAAGKLPYALLYFLVGLVVLDWAAVRYAAANLRVTVRLDQRRFTSGDLARPVVTLHNEGLLPVPWVALREGPDARPVAELSLGPLESRRLAYAVGPLVRGRHQVGGLEIRVFDLFGAFALRLAAGTPHAITVYPRVPRLRRLRFEPAPSAGPLRRRRWSREDTSHLAGLRPFTPGDHPKAIHWKVTARRGEPFVRRFEATTAPAVTVCLDLTREAHAGSGPDASVERAVEVAAGVLRLALEQGRPTRLVAFGRQPLELGPLTGPRAFGRFLEALVDVEPAGRAGAGAPWSLAPALAREARLAPPGSSLVAITARPDPALAGHLAAASAAGHTPVLVLLRAETFGAPLPGAGPGSAPPPSAALPASGGLPPPGYVERLRARGVTVFLLARDDDPAAVLEGGRAPGPA